MGTATLGPTRQSTDRSASCGSNLNLPRDTAKSSETSGSSRPNARTQAKKKTRPDEHLACAVGHEHPMSVDQPADRDRIPPLEDIPETDYVDDAGDRAQPDMAATTSLHDLLLHSLNIADSTTPAADPARAVPRINTAVAARQHLSPPTDPARAVPRINTTVAARQHSILSPPAASPLSTPAGVSARPVFHPSPLAQFRYDRRPPPISHRIHSTSSVSSHSASVSSSVSSASSISSSSCAERDLFPQPAQFDMRIPILPDPSPLADPSGFFFPSAGADLPARSKSAQQSRSPSPALPADGWFADAKRHRHSARARTTSPPPSHSHHHHHHAHPQPLEQVGVPATGAPPLAPALDDAAPPVRVQFREELLFGGGGCIDDDDDVVDEYGGVREGDDEYDADDDDASDTPGDDEPCYRGRPLLDTNSPPVVPPVPVPPRDLFPPMDLTFEEF